MTPDCGQLDAFLDKRLEGPALAAYQLHWQSCGECAERVRHWSTFHQAALVWQGENRVLPLVTASKADALIAKAAQQPAAPSFGWRIPAFAAVAVCATVGVIASVYFRAPAPAQPSPWTAPMLVLDSSAEGISPVGATLEAPEDGVLRARLGADRLALASGSRVSVTRVSRQEVRLRLDEGSIALDINPRAEGESLWVDVGGVTVRVIGTRFRVAKEGGISVLVNHGRVRVTDAQGLMREVGRGEVLTIDDSETRLGAALGPQQQRLDSELDGTPAPAIDDPDKPRARVKRVPPVVKAPPATDPVQLQVGQSNPVRLEGWRSQISNGRLEAARTSLAAHLKIAPLDFEAWLLLAECHRKQNNLNEALAAYRVVIDGADRATANSARLTAATVLQEEGRDPAAAKLFSGYLDNAIASDAPALLKLARAKIAAGRRAEARASLERVVSLNRTAPEAQEAAQLLETMK